jgi:hypothetical protein
MSSTGQATSSAENLKPIIDAFDEYIKETGIDLSKNPFATNLERWESYKDILKELEDQEKTFKEFRNQNRRLIDCLSPVVNVIHGFSDVLGKAVGLVSRTSRPVSLYHGLARSTTSHQQAFCMP